MCKLTRIAKQHNAQNGKRGFTLVELTVVMALMAILATMIVTFSGMMSEFAGNEQAEYDFLEDTSKLKETLSNWLAEQDVAGATFCVSEDKIEVNEGEGYASFRSGTLQLNEKGGHKFDEIASVTFDVVKTEETDNEGDPIKVGKLIRCTVSGFADGEETSRSTTFVFAPRCATIVEGGSQ